MPPIEGLRLEFSNGSSPLSSLADINGALAVFGSRVWSLDLSAPPPELRQLLNLETLTEAEVLRLKQHFLLPRERLLELISEAGRTPHVEGGGEMSTFVSTHGYAYPQLFVARAGQDYSRFDRFHVNIAPDGTAVDEILQVLSGGGIRISYRRSENETVTLELECPDRTRGWLVTYDGGQPHIGSMADARLGTKALVQIIGPARWKRVPAHSLGDGRHSGYANPVAGVRFKG
jgi:hypothetical protein